MDTGMCFCENRFKVPPIAPVLQILILKYDLKFGFCENTTAVSGLPTNQIWFTIGLTTAT